VKIQQLRHKERCCALLTSSLPFHLDSDPRRQDGGSQFEVKSQELARYGGKGRERTARRIIGRRRCTGRAKFRSVGSLTRRSHDSRYFSHRVTTLSELLESWLAHGGRKDESTAVIAVRRSEPKRQSLMAKLINMRSRGRRKISFNVAEALRAR